MSQKLFASEARPTSAASVVPLTLLMACTTMSETPLSTSATDPVALYVAFSLFPEIVNRPVAVFDTVPAGATQQVLATPGVGSPPNDVVLQTTLPVNGFRQYVVP